PWAAAEAARLDERRRGGAERGAEAMLALGAAAEAVPDLEAHAAAEPLREEAWRLLALALYRASRQGDALAALRRARATLTEELGVDPGPALRDLEAGILAHSPDLAGGAERPARPVVRLAPPEPPGAVFVGRARELARLDEAARAAEAGRGGTVLISGDAGMGKTALTERFARLLSGRGWTSAWGRAPETGGAPAAWPWAELLRDLTATAPPAAGLAARLAPLLDDTATGRGDTDVSAGRFRLHLAVGDYLAGLAEDAPLLLVLEDLHWADEETLALLTRLTGRLRDRRVLLAATFRQTEVPDPLAVALAVLARQEPARIELPGLSAAEVAALVRGICDTRLGDAELSAIAERTGGNPFFTRETARLLEAEGLPAATRRVPAGVGDVLRRRIARLPEPAQAVLRDAAVAGRDAGLDVLADLSGDEDAVIDAVESALAAGLVTEPAPGRMRFAHALVRDTLYTGLSRARRTRLHGRVAASLERHSPDEVAAIAHHYLESGTAPDRAVRYARRAAEAAEARYAHRLAADLWVRAAETLRARGDGATRERLEIEAAAIRATALAGQVVDARDRRRRAIADARAFGDVRLLARIIAAFDVPTLWTSREYGLLDREVIEAAGHALAGPPGDDPALRARLLTTLAIELEGEQDDRGAAAAREAVGIARGLGDPALLAAALNGGYLNGYRSAEGLHDRRRIAAELLALATEHELPGYLVLAHLQSQQAEVASLDLAAARRHLDEGRRLAEQYGLPLLAMIADWYGGLAHTFGARFEEAERIYTAVGGAIGRTGIWNSERGMMLVGAFCLRYVQGRAGELAGETAWLSAQWPHVAATADIHVLALVAAGRIDEARRAAPADPAPVRRDYFYDLVMAIRARRAIALGDRALAAAAYDALLPYEGHITGGATAVATIGPVAQILGDLARFLGRPAASAHYRKAAEVADRLGAPFWADQARDAQALADAPAV
ncbi:ATP-binding protein, partial [Actinomadura napierensis]|uniref:ATP-binding protein n=1 Tax=Actinomadura napierensis TaxID=267854 RepID=UPI0031D8A2F7